jgi:hypothetical protein
MSESAVQFPTTEDCAKVCSPWRSKPYGVVSLLDMLKRYAFGFYEVTCRLEALRSTARIYEGTHQQVSPLYEHHRTELLNCLTEMRVECDKLELANTTNLILYLESEVTRKGKDYTNSDLLNSLNTLGYSFSGELRRRLFLGIEDDKNKFFQNGYLLGRRVNNAFPSCVTESRDAGNCYALEQYEATGFHSMRILERGLGSLAKKFGVDFNHTNCTTLSNRSKRKLGKWIPPLELTGRSSKNSVRKQLPTSCS